MSPKIVLIPFYNANWQLFTYFFSKSTHFLAISSLKVTARVGFFANFGHFQGFKKPRIANPRNTKPRIARNPCIFCYKISFPFILITVET